MPNAAALLDDFHDAVSGGDMVRASALASAMGLGGGNAYAGGGAVLAYANEIREALRADGLLRGAVITIADNITTTTAGSTFDKTYKVPSDEILAITAIRGDLLINDFSGETLSVATLGNPTVSGRLLMKAMNCRLNLVVDDDNRKLFEGQALGLAGILTHVGGHPIEKNPPDIVLDGETLKLTATLQDTTADVVGASTRYGIVIVGDLVKAPKR